MSTLLRTAIVGGSGYTGGELARLLLFHPRIELVQVASSSHAGQYLYSTHPNLRKLSDIRYCHPDDIARTDILFLCLPHGASAKQMARFQDLAPLVVDLSADFRLRSPDLYRRWYGQDHPRPDLLHTAVYGLPELHRRELAESRLISGTGCMATASILGLAPLFQAGLVDNHMPVVVEAKVGSSAAGATPTPGSHHPERSGSVRSFQPTGHRHTAELIQELGLLTGEPLTQPISFSATSIEMVRGILITAHIYMKDKIEEKLLWRVYREAYRDEPFIRLVKERNGIYRYPEPKILAGSNYCDIGFELDREQNRVVVMAALDNLMKGAAGNALQSTNIACGWNETTGLEFPGLHPI